MKLYVTVLDIFGRSHMVSVLSVSSITPLELPPDERRNKAQCRSFVLHSHFYDLNGNIRYCEIYAQKSVSELAKEFESQVYDPILMDPLTDNGINDYMTKEEVEKRCKDKWGPKNA